jgi:hypothetical protein
MVYRGAMHPMATVLLTMVEAVAEGAHGPAGVAGT